MTDLLSLFARFAGDVGVLDDSFVVGGTVRDLLLGKTIKDLDVALSGSARTLAREFSQQTGASFVSLDEEFDIARVVKGGAHIDLSALRGASILEDLSLRDLTINAMAIPLRAVTTGREGGGTGSEPRRWNGPVIDPCNGMQDLWYGIVRMVSEENLVQDPLRLLRVYRFSSTLNFLTEVSTASAVGRHAALISGVAPERIAHELRHILRHRFSGKTLKDMHAVGLLAHVFPEIVRVPDESWMRVQRSYAYAEHILENLHLYFPGSHTAIASYFGDDHRLVGLKLALLLSHGNLGYPAAMRLRMSGSERDFVRQTQEDRFGIERISGASSRDRLMFLKKCRDHLYALAVWTVAENLVCQCEDHPLLRLCRELLASYQGEFMARQRKLPVLRGDDLVKEFGLSPSPVFGEVLSAVEDLVLEGRVSTRHEALDAVRDMLGREDRLCREV